MYKLFKRLVAIWERRIAVQERAIVLDEKQMDMMEKYAKGQDEGVGNLNDQLAKLSAAIATRNKPLS